MDDNEDFKDSPPDFWLTVMVVVGVTFTVAVACAVSFSMGSDAQRIFLCGKPVDCAEGGCRGDNTVVHGKSYRDDSAIVNSHGYVSVE